VSDKKTRIHHATVKAQEAFWTEIAGAFPEVKSGDFDPQVQLAFDEVCASAVTHWVDINAPAQ